MSDVTTVGIDLAKNVVSVHGTVASWHRCRRRREAATKRRSREAARLVARLPSCLVGMEARSGANDWARCFVRLRHRVRLIADLPQGACCL
jgi:transposase